MFKTYKVITITINNNDGESHDYAEKATEKEAMDLFYNRCSSYGTNPATKACEVVVLNPDGDLVRMEKIDNGKYIVEE